MPLTFDDVWRRIFSDIEPRYYDNAYDDMRELCNNIASARNIRSLSCNQTANLMRGIRRDIKREDNSWKMLLCPRNFGDFLANVESFQQIRGEFKSRDKEALDPMCAPYSNEILFGKGLNSHVRDAYFEN